MTEVTIDAFMNAHMYTLLAIEVFTVLLLLYYTKKKHGQKTIPEELKS